MQEKCLWSIGSTDGRSDDLLDNYRDPNLVGDVVWQVDETVTAQKWPLFHPSEADPDGGYRLHPYTVEFTLPHEPAGVYLLRLGYLAIMPRLAYLELQVNGTPGVVYLRPHPSHSGQIQLHAGLHTSIYAEGQTAVTVPATLLRQGLNRLQITSRDGGQVIFFTNAEKIKRLDRMATGAGFIYQHLSFWQLPQAPGSALAGVQIMPSVLYRRDQAGRLLERCHLYVEFHCPVAEATWRLLLRDSAQSDTIELLMPAVAFGHVRRSFDLFDGQEPVTYSLQAQVNGKQHTESGRLKRRRKWKVFVAPHAHTDIGYTHRQWEVAERLCRNLDTALDLLGRQEDSDEPPAFAYHLDASWTLQHYLATRDAGQIQRLVEQITAGHLALPANYAILLSQYASLESLIRNHHFSHAFLQPLGLQSSFAAVVDVPSLTGSLPAILEGCGVRYLVHAANQDRGPIRVNGDLHRRSPFYWQGANQTNSAAGRVLVWLAKMYCELRKVCGSPPDLGSAERGLNLWLDEYERDDYAPDAVLLYGQEADNTDLDRQPVNFIRHWNQTYVYPQLIPCSVPAFFTYVEEHFGAGLETVTGDSGAYWEDGVGSTMIAAAQARQAQAMLPAAERLEALSVIHGPGRAFPQDQFDHAWEQLLLFTEHTWGAFLSAQEPEALLQQDQWAVKAHMAQAALQWATRLLHTATSRHSLSWNTEGREVVVYNPHSWPVSGAAVVEIGRHETIVDPLTGKAVPVRRLRTLNTQAWVELWLDHIEGLSYRRFLLKEDTVNGSHSSTQGTDVTAPIVLENEHYRLVIDPRRGCVTSCYDHLLQKELVDKTAAWGLGQFLYARGGEGTRLHGNQADLPPGNPHLLAEFDLHDCLVDHSGTSASVTLRGAVPAGLLTIEWSLPHRARHIDVAYTYQKEERLESEAAYVAFPLALPAADVLSDSQLGWVNWNRETLPGACLEWLPLQTGILVNGAGADVFIASPDVFLFCVGDIVRGRWPKEQDLTGGRLFSYVLNNYWRTNYKASQSGEITFRYRLASDRAIPKDRAFHLGWETRQPLYAQRISLQEFRHVAAPYHRVEGGALACIDNPQVILSTLKAARLGPGIVARLQEIAGRAQSAVISFPGRPISQAWETDLLECDGRRLPVQPDGALRVELPAWGLATVRLEFV